MSKNKDEFIRKLKEMPVDELIKYESAALMASRIIDLLGVSLMLIMICVPEIPVFLVCGLIVYLLANMGAGVGNSLNVIREQLGKLDK